MKRVETVPLRAGRLDERVLRRLAHGCVERFEPVPGDGGLERVVDDAHRHGQLAPIGHADEGRAPALARRLVGMMAPAVIGHEFDRPLHPRVHGMVGGFEGEHEQALLIGVDAIGARFGIVDDAQVRGIKPGLRDGAHGSCSGKEIRQAEDRVGAEARAPLEPHPGLGDHAERPFRADHHPVGAGARAGARQAARFHDARWRQRAQAFDEIVDMGVEGGEVAARAGGDPAAER